MGEYTNLSAHSAGNGQLQMDLNFASESERKLSPGVYVVERVNPGLADNNPEHAWNCKAVGIKRLLASPPSRIPETHSTTGSLISFEADSSAHYLSDSKLASKLDEGYIVTVDQKGNYEIDWALMLMQAGITVDDIEEACGKDVPDVVKKEVQNSVIHILYLLFSGRALHQSDLASVGRSQVKAILMLCHKRGLFLEDAAPIIPALLAERLNEDIYERLKYMLSLSRKAFERSGAWPFDKASFLKSLSWLPSVYERTVQDIADQVDSLCNRGIRPTIMVKAPGGAPVEEISTALAQALSRETGYSYIDGSSITAPLDLIGTNSSFNGASVGRIARILFTHKARALVIGGVEHLADLKKTDGDPIGFLAQCVKNGAHPIDSFIEVPMNMDDIAFVLTEGSDATTELDRSCSITLSIGKLSRVEKIKAAVELLANYNLSISEQDATILVDNYAFDDGITLLCNAINALAEAAEPSQKSIDAAFIKSALPTPNEDDPRLWVAKKRARLEMIGGQCVILADQLLSTVLAKTNDTIAQERAKSRLKMLLGSVPNGQSIPTPNRKALISRLQATHPGITNHDLEALVAAVMASVRNARHPRPILLVGPAGTGKTTIIGSIAEALGGLHVVKKDMPAMSTVELFGAANSMPSVITESISLLDGEPGILHLDECDKMDPKLCSSQSLCSLLDEGMIDDCYLNTTCDYSKWLVILTANDLCKVSPYVLNRSQIVHLEGYPPSNKAGIARKVLINRKSTDLGVKPPHIDEDALLYLASLDDEAGLRSFENRLELAVSEIEKKHVTLPDVESLFPREETSITGVPMLMARGGAKGGVALDSVVAVKLDSSSHISTLTDGTAFNNSLNTAVSALVLGMGLDTSGVMVALEEVDDLDNTHAPHGTLAVAVAIWFAANGVEATCPGVAFVGNLGLTGNVKPLDAKHIPKGVFMVARAAAHGINTIVCPENLADVPDVASYAKQMGIDLVTVDHVEEAVNYAKGRHSIADLIDELETIHFKI